MGTLISEIGNESGRAALLEMSGLSGMIFLEQETDKIPIEKARVIRKMDLFSIIQI